MAEDRATPPAVAVPRPSGPDRERPILLVLRALGLGDFATAVPALRALDRAFPGHRRILAGPDSYDDLLALAGLAWETVTVDGPHTPPWNGLDPPDLAINLHGRGPQSVRALAALRPRRLWTHRGTEQAAARGPDWVDDLHEVDRWCRLLSFHGVPVDPEDLRWPAPVGGAAPAETAVVHPGAASASRRWPELRFAEVARHLRERGLRVAVTGSAEEHRTAERVARVAGLVPQDNVAGATGLSQLAALVAGARLVVSGDTGVAHLATAYGTPSVVLFGPCPPGLWGPRIDTDRHRCLWAGTTGDPHADRIDPGLASITADEVLAACDDLLAASLR